MKEHSIYAIIRSGGKQYRVEPDQAIDVERLPAQVGSMVEITDVLLVAQDGEVRLGRPHIEGARVIAEVVGQGRADKVVVFKYKAKTRYRRKLGHRQPYTRLAIRRILLGDGAPVEAAVKPATKRARAGRKRSPETSVPAEE